MLGFFIFNNWKTYLYNMEKDYKAVHRMIYKVLWNQFKNWFKKVYRENCHEEFSQELYLAISIADTVYDESRGTFVSFCRVVATSHFYDLIWETTTQKRAANYNVVAGSDVLDYFTCDDEYDKLDLHEDIELLKRELTKDEFMYIQALLDGLTLTKLKKKYKLRQPVHTIGYYRMKAVKKAMKIIAKENKKA